MSLAKLIEKRTHQLPGQLFPIPVPFALSLGRELIIHVGKLTVSELFFQVPKDYSQAGNGNLRLFARSVERFDQPVDITKSEVKQLPWRTFSHLVLHCIK